MTPFEIKCKLFGVTDVEHALIAYTVGSVTVYSKEPLPGDHKEYKILSVEPGVTDTVNPETGTVTKYQLKLGRRYEIAFRAFFLAKSDRPLEKFIAEVIVPKLFFEEPVTSTWIPTTNVESVDKLISLLVNSGFKVWNRGSALSKVPELMISF